MNVSELSSSQINSIHSDISEDCKIIACAGSGKTRVCAHRLIHLVQSGLPASSILAVSFTNKSAKELQDRIHKYSADSCKVKVTTLHAACTTFLRKCSGIFNGYTSVPASNFQIIDANEQKSLVRKLAKSLLKTDNATEAMKEEHAEVISLSLEAITKSKEYSSSLLESYLQSQHKKQIVEIYNSYNDYCERNALLDFSDIVLKTIDVLKSNSKIKQWSQKYFQHLLVDEFQDISKLQFKALMLLTNCPATVVGDPDQSIYSFRAAEPDLLKRFSFYRSKPCRTYALDTNFRSKAGIIDASYRLLTQGMGDENNLIVTSDKSSEAIKITHVKNEYTEADLIANEVKSLISTGASPSDIAVLYRLNNQSTLIEKSLAAQCVKYKTIGGINFFENTEVKSVLSYIKLVTNPNNIAAFMQAVQIPKRRMGKVFIEKIEEISELNKANLVDALAIHNKPNSNLLSEQLIELKLRLKTSLEAAILYVINDMGVGKHFSSINSISQDSGKEKLIELVELSKSLKNKDVHHFLESITLDSRKIDNSDSETVNLMTCHSSKGMEFKHVLIAGLKPDLMPYTRSVVERGSEGLEEERRILYVAMTRAVDSLHIFSNSSSDQNNHILIPDEDSTSKDCSDALTNYQFIHDIGLNVIKDFSYDKSWMNYNDKVKCGVIEIDQKPTNSTFTFPQDKESYDDLDLEATQTELRAIYGNDPVMLHLYESGLL